MLAPQQTIMRASANLRSEDAAANIQYSILNTLPIKVIARRKKLREVDFVFCSRPQFVRFAAASSATAGRESCYRRPRIDDFL